MKKITLLLSAALIMGTTTFAHDGHKDCKGKKEASSKEACGKGKGCCKKGEGKTATVNDASKAPVKETKTNSTAKKS